MIILLLIVFSQCRDVELLNQEISQLEYLIQLQQEKLHYLKELRMAVTEQNKSIPIVDENVFKELQQNKPYKQGGKQNEQLERALANRMLKKYSFTINSDNVTEASLLPTQTILQRIFLRFQYRSQSEMSQQLMLYVINNNQTVQLFDLNAQELVHYNMTFQPGFIQISGRTDDPILFLANEQGDVEIAKIENVKMVEQLPEGKQKTRFVVQLNQELRFQIDFLKENQTITTTSYSMFKGLKYLLFGTSTGDIIIYHRNGTLVGLKSVGQSVISIQKSYPNSLYLNQNGFGYISPSTLDVVEPQCVSLPFKILSITTDIQQSNIVYALSDQMEVYVFEIRTNEQCKMKLKLNQPFTLNFVDPKLISLRAYLIVFDQATKQSLLFNTTEVLNDMEHEQPALIDIFNNQHSLKTNLQSIKGTGLSHFMIIKEIINNVNQISYYEITMPQKKESDFFSNLRFPIVIVAIVMVLLYQFWYRGGSKKNKNNNQQNNQQYDDSEIEQLLRGGAQMKQQLRQNQQLSSNQQQQQQQQQQVQPNKVRFNEDINKLDKFKEQLNTLDYKTKQLNEKVGVQSQIDQQRQRVASNSVLQNKKYV